MNDGIRIRRAEAHEADICAGLLYASAPELYRYCFVKSQPRLLGLFELMLRMPGTMYSMEHTMIEVQQGKARGLILGYPAREMRGYARGLLKRTGTLIAYVGPGDFFRMLWRLKLNRYMPGTEDDEFFVSNVAVKEAYRGQGTATRLMKKVEEMALAAELQKVSLYVETHNPIARRLYEKLGYRETDTRFLPDRYSKHGLVGFSKMTKVLQ